MQQPTTTDTPPTRARAAVADPGNGDSPSWFDAIEDDYELGGVLRTTYASLHQIVQTLRRDPDGAAAVVEEPFRFDSSSQCVQAYVAALRRTRERFWATTFLSSGFWSQAEPVVIDANLVMLGTLGPRDGAVRRLFILPVPPAEEVERWQERRIFLLKTEDEAGLASLDESFTGLRTSIDTLSAHGCEFRVVCDPDAVHEDLPAPVRFDPHDVELAIYDDWRFDLFQGGSFGTIRSVDVFTPAMTDFDQLRAAVENHFGRLWEAAQPVATLLDQIERAIEYSSSRIDYQPVWLAKYDHGLPEDDRLLKAMELSAVKSDLRQLGRWGDVRRFLDIGTCTGRYPLALRDAVREDGTILGIDNDNDCVRFARSKVERQPSRGAPITIEQRDFSAEAAQIEGPFDLITCMLGTVVHLTRDTGPGAAGELSIRDVLSRLGDLLAPDGLLFFSVWSEEACQNLAMLSIYSPEDMERLARWAPRRDDLEAALADVGLYHGSPRQLEDRIDLYQCSWSAEPLPL